MKPLMAMVTVMTLSAEQRLVEGSPASPVRVVIYEDLQCPDCADFRRMMDDHLLPRYGSKVAFEHRDFPLPKHSWARKAAIAARYFDSVKPELGVGFRRETMAKLRDIPAEKFDQHVAAFAKARGTDPAAAAAALNDAKLGAHVEEDWQEGIARGIGKTPTVLVNGEPFIERFPLKDLMKAIDAALAGAAK
jgi:protein-disulfide isomerase